MVGAGRVLYRVPTRHVPGPIIQSYLALRPYPRPYEGSFLEYDEVPEIGSRIGSRYDPRMTLQDPSPDRSPDGSQMALRSLYGHLRNGTLRIRPYLTLY